MSRERRNGRMIGHWAVSFLLSLAAFAAAIAGAMAVVLGSSLASGRPADWAFATLLFWMGCAGLIAGLSTKRSPALIPLVAGWALPIIVLFALTGPIAPDSVWAGHIERIVKISWFVTLPVVGMLSQLYGAAVRRDAAPVRVWLFVLALFALTAGYHVALSTLNSVYPHR